MSLSLDDCLYGLRNLSQRNAGDVDRIVDYVDDLADLDLRKKVEDLISHAKYAEAYELALRPTLEGLTRKDLFPKVLAFARDFITEEDVELAARSDGYKELLIVTLIEDIFEQYERLLNLWWTPKVLPLRADVPVEPEIIEEGPLDIVGMLTFLQAAQERGLQMPKASFLSPELKELKLSLGSRRSAFPQGMEVRHGSIHIGTILPNGFVIGVLAKEKKLIQTLSAIAEETQAAAKLFADFTNTCSFCGQPLSADERRLGYGPVCAISYGMPWD